MSDETNRDTGNSSSSTSCARCGVWCTCSKYNSKTSFSLSTTNSLIPKTETIKKAEKEKIEKKED